LYPWETPEMYITSWVGIGIDEIVKKQNGIPKESI
jgi:hypothetical protein